jgi:hypothetical protein|eukprot:g187.t1
MLRVWTALFAFVGLFGGASCHVFNMGPPRNTISVRKRPLDDFEAAEQFNHLEPLRADISTRGKKLDTKAYGIKYPVDVLVLEENPNVMFISQFMENQVVKSDEYGTLTVFAKGVYCETSQTCSILSGPWGLQQLGQELFVASFSTDQILVFDIDSGEFQAAFGNEEELNSPEGMTMGSDGLLYVASYLNNEIVAYNPATREYVGTIVRSGTLSGPEGIAFLPAHHAVVATSHWSDSVMLYDVPKATAGNGGRAPLELSKEFKLPEKSGPVGVLVDDEDHVLVSLQGNSNTIVRLNVVHGNFSLFSKHPRMVGPAGMAWIGKQWYDGVGKSLVVASYNTHALLVFNVTNASKNDDGARKGVLVAALK